jgi:hypothetical protein
MSHIGVKLYEMFEHTGHAIVLFKQIYFIIPTR